MTHSIERPFRPFSPGEDRLASFQLAELEGQVKQEESYARSGKSGLTLIRHNDLTVVLTVLRKGTEIHEHKAPASATVLVLEGEIDFCGADGEHVRLGAGNAVIFGVELPHRVLAIEDSAFLIVIGGQPT